MDSADIQLWWPQILALGSFALSVYCSGHAVLNKRDSRAATGWVGIIWFVPLVGAALYWMFGRNRIRRFAKVARGQAESMHCQTTLLENQQTKLSQAFPQNPSLIALARLGTKVTQRPLLRGNRVTALENGDAAYPEMIGAIQSSKSSITLSTYIFDNDCVGKLFIEALSAAVARGVQVRVLIDDIGLRYSWRSVLLGLRQGGVPVARFMGALRPMTFPHLNLRKHRKLLVCDGRIAFTGGMNIREGHELSRNPKHPVQDLHFKVEGPLVAQLQEVFAEDWAFTTTETLAGKPWFVEVEPAGETLARAITDGPDEDLNKLPLILEGAISGAQKSIWILTPYFLPDNTLITALYVAAAKGVSVNIVLPTQNNLPFVQWASNPLLLPLLEHGCRIWFSAAPFDHTKLMLVDDVWALFGSANLDPRSLRLNFELNVEAYDALLGQTLRSIILKRVQSATELTQEEMINRSLALRLRDGVARLFSPYL
jgi:cardiolipin synthase A/B